MIRTVNYLATSKCNIGCSFCLNAWKDLRHPGKFKGELDLFRKLRVIDRIAEERDKCRDSEHREKDCRCKDCRDKDDQCRADERLFRPECIIFTGGEPLIDKHLPLLVSHAKECGFLTVIQTNGTLITKEFLKSRPDAIQVSLEGTREVHNTVTRSTGFDAAIRGIRLVKECGITILTNFTIVRDNIECVEEYVKLVNDLGVDIANFTPLYPIGEGYNNHARLQPDAAGLEDFYSRLESIPSKTVLFLQGGVRSDILPWGDCGGKETELAIQPDGTVTPCPSNGRPLGNILTMDIETMLKQDHEEIEAGHHLLEMKRSKKKSRILTY